MIANLITLGFLVLLQAVLGFDNLLYISLESKRAPPEERARVRKIGIGLAVGLRIILLFALMRVIELVQDPLFAIHTHPISGTFNLHALIVLAGGTFIMYTAVKEIWHMLGIGAHAIGEENRETQSANAVIATIVVMNLVFSFDSILSAMALTRVFWIMATAILIGGILMIWLAERVSDFLQKNRMYEVLGLFVLLIVGVMLLSEGGHLAHMHLFGGEITAMSKATFYFVITVLVLTDLVQSRYQKRLMAQAKARAGAAGG